jgi:hypothetical protein
MRLRSRNEVSQTLGRADVADAALARQSESLEGGDVFEQSSRIANGSAGGEQEAVALYVADSSATVGAKPVVNAGVEDLVGGGIPPVSQDEPADRFNLA